MIPSFLLQKEQIPFENKSVKNNLSFIDKTAGSIAHLMRTSMYQWYVSQKSGLMQTIDERVKVAFLLSFVILANFTHSIFPQLCISSILLILIILSRLDIFNTFRNIFIITFFFGFIIFIPSCLNIVTKGQTLITLFTFESEKTWWIYKIPKEISVTREGVWLVVRLTLKVINSVAVIILISSTTTFDKIVKSLSFFKVPDIFILTINLTHKFILILSQTVEETYHALRMRWWNRGTVHSADEIVAGRIGYLFHKSWEKYELVYQSMIARGYTGTSNFSFFGKLKLPDYVFSCISLIIIALIILINSIYA